MARQLNLYSVGYNHDETTHFIFSSKATYLTALQLHLLFSLPFNTWRINGGRVLVSRSAFDASQMDFQKAVYVADVDGERTQEAVFYHVRRVYDQSEFIVLEITLDNWATFISNATLSQVHITRCNRAIGEGIYDEVKNTSGLLFNHYDIGALNRSIEDFCVVFLASVVIQTGFFGNDPLTQNVMLYLPLEEIGGAVTSAWQQMDIIEKVRFIMGGVYKTGAFGGSNNCGVLRCWILPKDAVRVGDYGLSSITTKTFITDNADKTFSNVHVVNSGERLLQYDFDEFINNFGAYYPNYALQFGCRGHAMPLIRYTDNRRVYARFFTESGEVRVQVEQGNNTTDVTPSFELDINANNQMGTGIQQLARNIGKFVGIAKASAKGYGEGGYAGAGLSLLTSSASAVSQAIPRAPSSNNGDAATTYSLNDAEYVMFPFVLAATKSIQDENANAYFMGATFDEYNSDFSAIQQSAHLGSVAQAQERSGTYIVADAMNVSGLNAEAEAFIRSEFKRGVWFEVI